MPRERNMLVPLLGRGWNGQLLLLHQLLLTLLATSIVVVVPPRKSEIHNTFTDYEEESVMYRVKICKMKSKP